ncbi:MAG: SEL1-like repeat protein [Synergistaceae bacterium]|nr:SEL1-like repeat protein [Synergistaceae bacterium]
MKVTKCVAVLALCVVMSAFVQPALAAQGLEEQFRRGVECYHQQNYAEAARLFRNVAEHGVSVAQYNLGLMYYSGQGVKQNYKEAFKWFRKAAEQGYADAQNNLGVMYSDGQGVKQNNAEALKWFRKAAAQGNVNAQNSLRELEAEAAAASSKAQNAGPAPTNPPAGNRMPFPQISEIESVSAFLNQDTPQLKSGRGADVVRYNITLLVAHAKANEALAYAQQYGKSLNNDLGVLFQYLQKVVRYDQQFRQDFNRVLSARDANNPRGVVEGLQSMTSEPYKYTAGIDRVPEMAYEIPLHKAMDTYYLLAQELKKAIPAAADYERKAVAEQNAAAVDKWQGFEGKKKNRPDWLPPEVQTDFTSNFDNLCQNGSVQELKAAFKQIPVNNPLNEYGTTPLMRAATFDDRIKVMQTLVSIGAKVGVTDKEGWTALDYAVSNGTINSVQFLLKQKAKPTRTTWFLAIRRYLQVNGGKVGAAFLEVAGPNTRKFSELTGARNIFKVDGADMMKILLKQGVSINQTVNDNGDTALMMAARAGDKTIVSDLLKRGANTNVKNKQGERALEIARKAWSAHEDGVHPNLYDRSIIDLLMKAMKMKSLRD